MGLGLWDRKQWGGEGSGGGRGAVGEEGVKTGNLEGRVGGTAEWGAEATRVDPGRCA